FQALRKMYSDAGVRISAYRIKLTNAMSDEEYDYAFKAALALGANQVTMEMPGIMGNARNVDLALTKRIGDFGSKYKVFAGYHNHLQASPTFWDEVRAQSPSTAAQIAVGHFVAASPAGVSPIETIQRHH